MATLLLQTPQQGETITHIIDNTITELDFGFPTDTALFEMIDDTLQIYLEDIDATIILDDFYAVYHEDFIPNFIFDGFMIAGLDFFEAFNPEIMPSFGLMTYYSNRNSLQTENTELTEGIDALEGEMGGSDYSADSEDSQNNFPSADSNNSGEASNTGDSSTQSSQASSGKRVETETTDIEETTSSNNNNIQPSPDNSSSSTPPLSTTSPLPQDELVQEAVKPDFDNSLAPNTAPTIDSVENLQAVENNVDNSVSGTVSVTDDYSQTNLTFEFENAINGTVKGVYGDISINSDGVYTYVLNNQDIDTNALKEGQIVTETFTVIVTDESGLASEQTITVTVKGTNDRPTLSVENLSGNEESATITGQAVGTDVDVDTVLTFSVTSTQTSPYGDFVIDANTGAYTFTLNDDAQKLAQGEEHSINYIIQVNDGNGGTTSQVVTVTITGTNDVPTLSVENISGNEESGTITGNAIASDVDTIDTHTFSVTSTQTSPYGDFVIDANTGAYTFTLNDDAQKLAQGEEHTIDYTIQVDDGNGGTTSQVVTVTITGTNDVPTLGVKNLSASDIQTFVSGKATASDIDNNAELTFSTKGEIFNEYGMFKINPETGDYTYTLFTNTKELAEGQEITQEFTVVVTDENGSSTEQIVTVKITGTNEAPSLTVNNIIGHEDQNVITGKASAKDVDNDAELTFSAEGTSEYGTFTIDPKTGDYTFTLNENAQSLEEGEVLNQNFTVTVTDEHGESSTQTVTVTVTGRSDAVEVLTVDNVTDDNTLNVFEASKDVAITGTIEGDFTEGDRVTVEVNGKIFEGELNADGSYSVNVSGNELSVDHEVTVTVYASDARGEIQPVTVTKEFTFKGDPLADDFVSINEGARVDGNLFSADEQGQGLTVDRIEAPEGWIVTENSDGSFTLTYEVGSNGTVKGNYTVEIATDGTFTYTGPTVIGGVDYNDINSIIKVVVTDTNGVEYDTTVTFANNAATQDNLYIDGDFTGNTVTVINRDSIDNTTYEYSTADYSGSSNVGADQLLSGFFLGENNDVIEVTGTVGYGEGKAHHIYGDELNPTKDGGHDEITVGELAAGGHIRGDGNLKAGLEGGDDVITVGTMNATTLDTVNETSSRIIGDGWSVNNGAIGGDDTISVDDMLKGEIAGDAYYLHGEGGDDDLNIGDMSGGNLLGDAHHVYASGVGGDDTIDVDSFTSKDSYISGDGYYVYGQGGDDTINVDEMSGRSIYGDANQLYGKGGDDTINVGTHTSGSIPGDGSIAHSGSQAGDDTINVDSLKGGNIYGDSYTEYGSAKSGSDTINIDTMSSGNIYADAVSGTFDDGGNDTVSVNEFTANARGVIDGGLGNDTFAYTNEEGANIDFSTVGSIKVDGANNVTIKNFENVTTGEGNDFIKVSSDTAIGNIDTGAGVDIIYSADMSMSDMLSNNNLMNAEIFITGGGISSSTHEEILQELGITQEGQEVTFDDTWTLSSNENGGSIYSNGVNEVWVKDPTVNPDVQIGDSADGSAINAQSFYDFDGNITDSALIALQDMTNDIEHDDYDYDDSLSGFDLSQPSVLIGLDGDATLTGGNQADILVGDEGEDSIMGGDGDDAMFGGDDDDLLFGDSGNDTIDGGAGEDILTGGDGEDMLKGGEGNDILIGGKGDDILTGGDGDDVFSWNVDDFDDMENDTVTDLQAGDTLDLSNFHENGYSFEVNESESNPNDVEINILDSVGKSAGSITLSDVEFSANDIQDSLESDGSFGV